MIPARAREGIAGSRHPTRSLLDPHQIPTRPHPGSPPDPHQILGEPPRDPHQITTGSPLDPYQIPTGSLPDHQISRRIHTQGPGGGGGSKKTFIYLFVCSLPPPLGPGGGATGMPWRSLLKSLVQEVLVGILREIW